MPEVNEAAVLNPSEFVSHLAELDLDSIGLAVRAEGVDWGEATIEAQMVKQAQGEGSAAGRRGGVPIRIPIRVQEESDVPLAVSAHKLDAVVARWQEEGGWIRRDYDDAAGFAGSLGYRIIRHTAALSGLQGWLFAHNRVAPDVFLTAVRWPIGFDPEKRESEWFDLEGREVLWEIEDMRGTAPGLIYIRYENQNDTEHLRGLRASIECRDHPQDETAETTARLSYAAAELTLRGGSKVVEDEGVEVVENDELTAGWITVFSSEITDVGHMTHAGPRRPWMRCKDLGEDAGGVEWRMRWRALGAPRWSVDPEVLRVPSRVAGEWDELDMGEARPQKPALGEPRWEFAIQARAPSGSGAMRVHLIRPEPTEQNVLVSSPPAARAADKQESKAPSEAESKPHPGLSEVVPWTSPESALAHDAEYAKCAAPRGASLGSGDWLVFRDSKFGLPEGASVLGVGLAVIAKASAYDPANAYVTGLVAYLIKNGLLDAAHSRVHTEPLPITDALRNFGAADDLWEYPSLTVADVNDPDFGFALQPRFETGSVEPGVTIDALVNDGHATVYYTEAEDPNRVCFAQRRLDLRTNGIHREDATDDVWGRLIEGGSLPYSPPSGLERRTARGIIVPSQGDFQTIGDEGSNVGRAQVLYQPGYLFAREAAD